MSPDRPALDESTMLRPRTTPARASSVVPRAAIQAHRRPLSQPIRPTTITLPIIASGSAAPRKGSSRVTILIGIRWLEWGGDGRPRVAAAGCLGIVLVIQVGR